MAAKRAVKRFTSLNETQYPTREVSKIARWVMRYLEVEAARTLIKVKHHAKKHAYSGRFYQDPHSSGGYIYDFDKGDWNDVRPSVPHNVDHLIVCRIGKLGVYPCENHVYQRKDSPGTWVVENWQEALVCIMAHEAMHLRQYLTTPADKRGRYNEVETEWAAYRLLNEWRAETA